MQQVAIMRTKKGFTVYSFDFTEDIYAVFEGEASLMHAIEFCVTKRYDIVNMQHFRRPKKEGRPDKEKKQENES